MRGANSFAKLAVIVARCLGPPGFWGLPVLGEAKCAKNDP